MKVHSVNSCDQGRRQKNKRGYRKNLDDRVLLVRDHSERGIEQETQFSAEESGVIAQRGQIAGNSFEVGERLALFRVLLSHFMIERDQAREANETFPRARNQVAGRSD